MSRCQWGLRRLAGLGCFWLAAAWATPARSAECGRTCLEGFAQRYLSALASHDPSLLVWAPRSRFSENGVFLHPGEALWGTVSSVDPVRDSAVDVADGGISFTVPVREGQRPALLAARLPRRIQVDCTFASTSHRRRPPPPIHSCLFRTVGRR